MNHQNTRPAYNFFTISLQRCVCHSFQRLQ